VSELGTLQPTDNAQARSQRPREIADQAAPAESTTVSFLKWFFSPPFARTISPGFKVPVCDYVRDLIKTDASAEADDEFPGHD
jgi:hypothetical protein